LWLAAAVLDFLELAAVALVGLEQAQVYLLLVVLVIQSL
jgi:hypothetical protein